jgi:outer membrane lipoprotein-sorting protein
VRSFLGSLALFVLLLVVTLVVALCTNGDETTTASLTSYYLRATIEVDGDDDDVLDTVQGWYQAPDRWRWDFGDEQDPDAGSVLMSDGESVVNYSRETNTYTRQSRAEHNEQLPPELREGPPSLPASIVIGWLPYGDIELFSEGLQAQDTEVSDGGRIAGRETEVVTLTLEGATVTLWVDREMPFALKYEARASSGPLSLIKGEIVEIDLNGALREDVFRFEPAAQAREIQAGTGVSGGSGSIGGSSAAGPESNIVSAPEGFLTPEYVPPAYEVAATGETHLGTGLQSRFRVRWEEPAGYLDMVQQYRAGGLSETQKQGSLVNIGGVAGYDQSTGELARLVFAIDDIVVTLEADALDLDELLRVAEGLR